MGCSSSSSPVETFAQLVQSSVTAVSAASDLASIIADLAGMTAIQHHKFRMSVGDDNTVLARLLDAMKQLGAATTSAYKIKFGSDPTGTDTGMVLNYSNTGDLDNVVAQIESNFSNWGISLSSDQILAMARTLQIECAAKIGKAGTSFGTYQIDSNDQLQWTVGYGLFAQTDAGVMAMVYAFSAQEVLTID